MGSVLIGDVEPGLEGDHLRPEALHGEGQEAGGRPELEDPLAGHVDPAEVGGLVAPQVPGPGQHRAVGHVEGVVPGEVAEVRPFAALRERLLEGRVELSQVVLGRVIGEEGARAAAGPAWRSVSTGAASG